MCLQPLVENAIHHGVGNSSTDGKVLIRGLRSGESLRIEVRDNGPQDTLAKDGQSSGIGLANTRARLRSLYGEAGLLTIEKPEIGGTLATVVIPYRTAAATAEPLAAH
jgi:LytS/YehU family sensor histidine kinase